jgi:hypothetical protein
MPVVVNGRSGALNRVANQRDTNGFAQRAIHFTDRTLLVEAEFHSGAIHIAVYFDASVTSFTAPVTNGKAADAASRMRRSILNHRWIEIFPISAGPADCTAKEARSNHLRKSPWRAYLCASVLAGLTIRSPRRATPSA